MSPNDEPLESDDNPLAGVLDRLLARERGGRPEASIWFDPGLKLPVADAAQVNAVMSDAAASDDSDLRNIVHAGTTLVATSLAIAERKFTTRASPVLSV